MFKNLKVFKIFTFFCLNALTGLLFSIIAAVYFVLLGGMIEDNNDNNGILFFGVLALVIWRTIVFKNMADKRNFLDYYRSKNIFVIILFLLWDVLIYANPLVVITWMCGITPFVIFVLLSEKTKYLYGKASDNYTIWYILLNCIFFLFLPSAIANIEGLSAGFLFINLFFVILLVDVIKNLFLIGGLYLYKKFPFQDSSKRKIYLLHQIYSYIAEIIVFIGFILLFKESEQYSVAYYSDIIKDYSIYASLLLIILNVGGYFLITHFMKNKPTEDNSIESDNISETQD